MAKAALTKKQLEAALKKRLRLAAPNFCLEKLPGGRFSGSIVSDTFQGVGNLERQKRIWDALDAEYGADSVTLVGTLLAYTRAEWNTKLAV
jgi:acid stress-induced BolA-like protein IbaG/YrbA